METTYNGLNFGLYPFEDSETCGNCGAYHDKENDKAEYCPDCMKQQKAFNNK